MSRRANRAGVACLCVLVALLSIRCATQPAPAKPPTRHLAVAEAAGHWLISQARRDGGVWTWPACPDDGGADVCNLYSGSAGVALLFCELHATTGDDKWLAAAHATARGLRASVAGMTAKNRAGLFTGVGGVLLALQVVWERTRDPALNDTIERGLEWYVERASLDRADAKVTFGPVTDVISGDAGIGELMLWFAARRPDSRARAVAAGVARHLIAIAEPAQPGFRWRMSPTYARAMPNYSHGTGGVAAFLVRAADLDPAALPKARGGAQWLRHLADRRGMIFHHQPGGEELFYWGWCHGPAGTSVLFARLARATGEAMWAEAARRPIAAVVQSGLPKARLTGLWNTVGQCCGTSGVGSYLLREAQGDGSRLRFCEAIADDIRERATADGDGLKWIQAEHRTRPDLMQAQVGWAQGAAGIGLWFLQLDAALRGGMPSLELPWTVLR